MRTCNPRWESGRLIEMYCSACGWIFPIKTELQSLTREEVGLLVFSYEEHDCRNYPRSPAAIRK